MRSGERWIARSTARVLLISSSAPRPGRESMSRELLLGATAAALVACLAGSPVQAQVVVPDASIEGPIQAVNATPGSGPLGGAPSLGSAR